MNTLVGRYEITRQLGGGGFAITYLARDTMQPSKPLCVVKQLRPNKTHPRLIELFHKEAAILEKLGKHPQIPQLLAHFQENDNLYIVQELIQGHDLSKEIFSGKRLSEGYASKLLQSILEILSFVHQQGVIHRDIKPQNLMRRQEDGRIFLIDFGAVKELGSLMLNSQGEVISSMVIGTPGYMPNEQGLGKPCLASDIYATGMTVIQALTGTQPSWLEENPETGEVIWLGRVSISQYLAEVITRMVRRHHSFRYSHARYALQALNLPTRLSPSVPPKPLPNPPIPINFSRRKALQIISFAGSGLLLTVGGKALFDSVSSPDDVSKLKSFDFETVTVNASGNIITRQPLNAKYFTEDLGNGVILEMVKIPGGDFFMGSPADEKQRNDDESPQHQVNVKPFFIGKFAVTQAQYQEIMGKNSSIFKGKKRPVESVTWNDATEFCQKLTEKTGREYRLPSEAEWEYACRAGTTTPFHFGATITTDLANYNGNQTYGDAPNGKYRQETRQVGSFPPNTFGLYDMHGNVLEWCQDTWHENYNGAPTDGSAWIENGNDSFRVMRGGCWPDDPEYCRSASRYNASRDVSNDSYFGFRVVCGVGRDS
ncbi:SUMF1/EgtB/PvdO family nonheme iron enzyme [Calothrix sp. CCY 0018]|uniref:bifunctional serine/threonine-protein kinase/formylglycine-generating enzyme family protein n=1 Tax=Calothrix sp. CCY 0018 TaxID=3103864 RepID=UPI0039C6275B